LKKIKEIIMNKLEKMKYEDLTNFFKKIQNTKIEKMIQDFWKIIFKIQKSLWFIENMQKKDNGYEIHLTKKIKKKTL